MPNLSPINLRSPPGFVDPQHEQRSSQAQPSRLGRNLENNLTNPGNERAQVSQNRNANVNASEDFKPIKGTEYLSLSVPGHILSTRKDQEIASEMWLKASLDLTWEASGHIPCAALITHLENFTFQSKAITPFLLERLRNNMLLWPSEITELKRKLEISEINETLGYTQDLNRLDNFLLGGHNWRNASAMSLDLAETRYLIWVT